MVGTDLNSSGGAEKITRVRNQHYVEGSLPAVKYCCHPEKKADGVQYTRKDAEVKSQKMQLGTIVVLVLVLGFTSLAPAAFAQSIPVYLNDFTHGAYGGL